MNHSTLEVCGNSRVKASQPHRQYALRSLNSLSPVKNSCCQTSNLLNQRIARELFQEIHGGQFGNWSFSRKPSNLKPWRWWKGASNDVMSLSWSPDGTKFAAGAITYDDDFNRGNNLILGDLVQNTLTELPGHYLPQADQSASSTDQSRCFATVSDSQWTERRLFTASYDRTVKIWDPLIEQGATCIETLRHDSKVVGMELSNHEPGLLATATASSFHLWGVQDNPSHNDLTVQRASNKKDISLIPTTLQWGQTPRTSHILAGGMAEEIEDPFMISRRGHLQLWSIEESHISTRKVTPDSQHIFDIKWHPFIDQFATASSSSGFTIPRDIRSVVQIYDMSDDFPVVRSRFPCPAIDINAVTFCPRGSYVTASCTDGSTYVWDERNPDKLLHKLSHKLSLHPMTDEYPMECVDYGVSVALWGTSIDQFFTGSSDGILNQWDIRRAPEDVLIEHTARFDDAITSGLFSDDKSHLLLGISGGGIHILSSGPCSDPEPGEMKFFHAPVSNEDQPFQTTSFANELIASEQLVVHPIFGPVQGPQYSGPYATWARGPIEGERRDLRDVPLLQEYKLRQFYGPPVKNRRKLDSEARLTLERYFQVAQARAQYIRPKRHESCHDQRVKKSDNPRSITTRSSSTLKNRNPGNGVRAIMKSKMKPIITKIDEEAIDLTIDLKHSRKIIDLTMDTSVESDIIDLTSETEGLVLQGSNSSAVTACKYAEFEEDYWWPNSG
ncbi:hypothetical protein PENSTE_c030G10016 [Penicillium steckii]|uniref:Uncharacterized protein n=1 Tax=Penicillium steckii TaxID=303698 RepID=A0A1V6SNE2_9EURO|nr:hypothetical protein PENSTE_c030G10016 [Penicillium steckii]